MFVGNILLEEQKRIFNELAEERSFESQNFKKILIPIIWYISTKLKESLQKILFISVIIKIREVDLQIEEMVT